MLQQRDWQISENDAHVKCLLMEQRSATGLVTISSVSDACGGVDLARSNTSARASD